MVAKTEILNKWKVEFSPKVRKTGRRMNLKGWKNEEFNFDLLNFRSRKKMQTVVYRRQLYMWDQSSGLETPV